MPSHLLNSSLLRLQCNLMIFQDQNEINCFMKNLIVIIHFKFKNARALHCLTFSSSTLCQPIKINIYSDKNDYKYLLLITIEACQLLPDLFHMNGFLNLRILIKLMSHSVLNSFIAMSAFEQLFRAYNSSTQLHSYLPYLFFLLALFIFFFLQAWNSMMKP